MYVCICITFHDEIKVSLVWIKTNSNKKIIKIIMIKLIMIKIIMIKLIMIKIIMIKLIMIKLIMIKIIMIKLIMIKLIMIKLIMIIIWFRRRYERIILSIVRAFPTAGNEVIKSMLQ